MRAVAKRRDGFTHDVDVDGHTLVVDEPEASGGADLGPTPVRLIAAALASCTAITIETYADRKGWDVGDLTIEVEMDGQASKGTAAFRVKLDLPEGLEPDQVDRITRIAGKCPVHKLLAGSTPVVIEQESS